jgi:glycosyltransferase involved in cell wall biosynthesis
MKTLFISAGPIEWGSSRMRCFWPAKYMDGAKVMTFGEHVNTDASVVIFQKVFDLEYARLTRRIGRRVFWDACDPAWWWEPERCREIIQNVDGVVLSSQALKDDFDQWNNGGVRSWCIPDRLELSHFPLKRQHADVSPVRLIWFGLAVNRWALLSALANLERLVANGHKIELTIMDDQPGEWPVTNMFPIYCVPWSLDKENEIIAAHDLAILPPYPGPWGEVKSNNRVLTAMACGLPVTAGLTYSVLEFAVKNWKERVEFTKSDMLDLLLNYDVEKSAREWEAICSA